MTEAAKNSHSTNLIRRVTCFTRNLIIYSLTVDPLFSISNAVALMSTFQTWMDYETVKDHSPHTEPRHLD